MTAFFASQHAWSVSQEISAPLKFSTTSKTEFCPSYRFPQIVLVFGSKLTGAGLLVPSFVTSVSTACLFSSNPLFPSSITFCPYGYSGGDCF